MSNDYFKFILPETEHDDQDKKTTCEDSATQVIDPVFRNLKATEKSIKQL